MLDIPILNNLLISFLNFFNRIKEHALKTPIKKNTGVKLKHKITYSKL